MYMSELDDANENIVITTMKLMYFVRKRILLLHIKNCVIWLCVNRSIIHYIKVDKEE